MEKMSLAMDLNTVTDLVVPVYTVLILVVLYMFNKASTRSNTKKIYTFEPPLSAGQKRVYSLKDFAGVWKQDSADDLDSWLIAHKKNFAVRIVASQMFFMQRNCYQFNEDFTSFDMIRDFGKGSMTYHLKNMPIADSLEAATDTKVPAEEGTGYHFTKAAFDKETGTFHVVMTEGPHVQSGCVNHMARSINPKNPDLMNAFWDCHFLDPKREPHTCKMNVVSCKVENDLI